jgi:ADP-ribose pyrophosphatase
MFLLKNTREIYSNRWITVTEDEVLRPGGQPGIFGVVTMIDGATVLPLFESGDVALVREYKYAVGRHTIEAMSGGVDKGEKPLDAARRELKEELGFTATTWHDLGSVDPFTSIIKCTNHMFLAEGLTRGPTDTEPGEIVEPVFVSLAEAVEMVMDGTITHSASCTLLLKAERFLRARTT